MSTAATLALLAEESILSPSAPLAALVEAARQRHGGVQAVLFYGSCRRDGVTTDRIADLYLLVASYREAHGSLLTAVANHLLPPNVYYLEATCEGSVYRAKYAVVTLAQIRRRVSPRALHPYFWARFCQPTAIAWCDDDATRQACVALFAEACQTMLAAALPTAPVADPAGLWQHALQQTYATELRAEDPGRAAVLLAHDRARYESIAAEFIAARAGHARPPAWRARLTWWLRRAIGKPLSILRLCKAAFTFAGGASYLAWKLERHSGVPVPLSAWQKRHPIIASIPLGIRLYRKGVFR